MSASPAPAYPSFLPRLAPAAACAALVLLLPFVACEKPRPAAEKSVAVLCPAAEGQSDNGGRIAAEDARRHIGELATTCPEGSFVFVPVERDLQAALDVAAADKRTGAILVYPAPQGTVAAFQKVRGRRPDLLLLAGKAEDDPFLIEASADLVAMPDIAAMAWNALSSAKSSGAASLRYLRAAGDGSPLASEFGLALGIAARRVGIAFAEESLADSAKDSLSSAVESLVSAAGSKCAWACGSDALVAPLVAACIAQGAVYLGSPSPSPTRGLPEGIGVSPQAGEAKALAALDKAVREKKAGGKIHAWSRSADGSVAAAMAELARRALVGRASEGAGQSAASQSSGASIPALGLEALESALRAVVPGEDAGLAYRVDAATGVRARNAIMVVLPDHTLGVEAVSKPAAPPLDYRLELGSAKKD